MGKEEGICQSQQLKVMEVCGEKKKQRDRHNNNTAVRESM